MRTGFAQMNMLRPLLAVLVLADPTSRLFAADAQDTSPLALAANFRACQEAQDSTVTNRGTVFEMKMESPLMSGTVTLKVKGDQARMDLPEIAGTRMSIVVDLKKGESTYLLHDQKQTMKVSREDQEKMARQQEKEAGIDITKIKKPEPTGEKEKVGKWDTEIFETMVGKDKARLWVAKDYPNYKAIRELEIRLNKATGGGFDPSQFDLGGMVVKSIMTIPTLGETTTTLIGIKEAPVEDADFKKPEGYEDEQKPDVEDEK